MEQIVASLSEINADLQAIAICGKSTELKSALDRTRKELQKRNTRLRLQPIGFTKEMDEWMAASDLLIGKPGGLTTSEALCRGLPMLIVNPIPGQEERNADHLLEWGCAVRCNNLATLDYKLGQLLKDDRLRIMSDKCRQHACPSAAEMIGQLAGF